MSFRNTVEQLRGDCGYKVDLTRDDESLSYAGVLERLQHDAAFRIWFNSLLAEAPYAAFRWETPPLTRETASRPFEFVIFDAPRLSRRPDAKSFAEHFQTAGDRAVVVFPNLGRDGLLVVPCPMAPNESYVQIGDFVRKAPAAQIDDLWRLVGETTRQRFEDLRESNRSLWLSTAGGGVAWLHVRIDDHPKYYHHKEYRKRP